MGEMYAAVCPCGYQSHTLMDAAPTLGRREADELDVLALLSEHL